MGNNRSDSDVLASGKTSFKIEVPYQLIETGEKNLKKPLILYLHGFGENIKTFQKKCARFMDLDAYHLFVQGPYPLYDHSRKKSVSSWGRSWYLYDGKRKQFIKSLEVTSEFIQEIVDNLIQFINVSKLCVVGYSMGGYQAGHFALTRWKHVNGLVVVGGRIKTEIVSEEDLKNLSHMNVLAIHGKKDDKVDYKGQEDAIAHLNKHGVKSELLLTDGAHEFSEAIVDEIINWLQSKDY